MPGIEPAPLIAIVLPDLHPGGAERMRVNLAHEWVSRGFRVDFVLLQKRGELLKLLPSEVRVMPLNVRRFRSAIRPLRRYVQREAPTIVLAAMWPLTVVAIVAVKLSKHKCRVIVSDHNNLSTQYVDKSLFSRLILSSSIRTFYPLAEACIAVSYGVAADLVKLSGLGKARFSVVYNPAATKQGGEAKGLHHPQEFLGKRKAILNIGTLKKQKNQSALIEAFSKFPEGHDYTLYILGEGSCRGQLEQLIELRGLKERVFLVGFCLDPTPYLQSAALFVLSSDYEGFGNVVVEALEQGVPVVSTDCPSGPREILCDGKYGRLVPVEDVNALSCAMLEELEKKHDHEALKRRASDFSVGKIAEEYLDVMLPDWRYV